MTLLLLDTARVARILRLKAQLPGVSSDETARQ